MCVCLVVEPGSCSSAIVRSSVKTSCSVDWCTHTHASSPSVRRIASMYHCRPLCRIVCRALERYRGQFRSSLLCLLMYV